MRKDLPNGQKRTLKGLFMSHGNTDYIISGDKHILDLDNYKNIQDSRYSFRDMILTFLYVASLSISLSPVTITSA